MIVEFYGGNFCSDCGDSGFPVVYGGIKVLVRVDDSMQESVTALHQVAEPVGVVPMEAVQFGHGAAEPAGMRSECVHLIEYLQAFVWGRSPDGSAYDGTVVVEKHWMCVF